MLEIFGAFACKPLELIFNCIENVIYPSEWEKANIAWRLADLLTH